MFVQRESSHSNSKRCYQFCPPLLVLAGLELIFFIVGGTGLCFGFVCWKQCW